VVFVVKSFMTYGCMLLTSSKITDDVKNQKLYPHPLLVQCNHLYFTLCWLMLFLLVVTVASPISNFLHYREFVHV